MVTTGRITARGAENQLGARYCLSFYAGTLPAWITIEQIRIVEQRGRATSPSTHSQEVVLGRLNTSHQAPDTYRVETLCACFSLPCTRNSTKTCLLKQMNVKLGPKSIRTERGWGRCSKTERGAEGKGLRSETLGSPRGTASPAKRSG